MKKRLALPGKDEIKHCRKCGTKDNLVAERWLCVKCKYKSELERNRNRNNYARHKLQLADWKPPTIEACGMEFDEAVCPMRQKAAKYRHRRGQKVQILACLACERKVEKIN